MLFYQEIDIQQLIAGIQLTNHKEDRILINFKQKARSAEQSKKSALGFQMHNWVENGFLQKNSNNILSYDAMQFLNIYFQQGRWRVPT